MSKEDIDRRVIAAGAPQLGGSEDFDYLLCLPAEWPTAGSYFLTNEFGRCCRCHRAIQFRPESRNTPFRICPFCLIKMLEQEESRQPTPSRATFLEKMRLFYTEMETMAAERWQQNGVSQP